VFRRPEADRIWVDAAFRMEGGVSDGNALQAAGQPILVD
jgi:hypothetical protein